MNAVSALAAAASIVSGLVLLILLLPIKLTAKACVRPYCIYARFTVGLLFGAVSFSFRSGVYLSPADGAVFCGSSKKDFLRSVFDEKRRKKKSVANSIAKKLKGYVMRGLSVRSVSIRQTIGGAEAPDKAALISGLLSAVACELSGLLPEAEKHICILPDFSRGVSSLDIGCIALFRTGKSIIEVLLKKPKRSK